MKTIKLTVGMNLEEISVDLPIALEEIKDKVERGFTSGSYSNLYWEVINIEERIEYEKKYKKKWEIENA